MRLSKHYSLVAVVLGIILGVAVFYLGILISITTPALFFYYGLPISFIVAACLALILAWFRKKIYGTICKLFYISYFLAFIVSCCVWIYVLWEYSYID